MTFEECDCGLTEERGGPGRDRHQATGGARGMRGRGPVLQLHRGQPTAGDGLHFRLLPPPADSGDVY